MRTALRPAPVDRAAQTIGLDYPVEQCVLAAWLLAGDRSEVTLPDFWVCTEPDLHAILAPFWNRFPPDAIATNGTGFWVTVG